MFKLPLAIMLVSIAQIGAKPNIPRIIGGSPVEEGKFPFAASISLDTLISPESTAVESSTEEYTRTDHICGAIIIDERHLLTSAYCILQVAAKSVHAYVGSVYLEGNGTYYNISHLAVHPHFSTSTLANDIGIIRLKSPILFSGSVQPVNLPINITVNPGDNATVIGWGTLSYPEEEYSNQLQELTRPVVDDLECANALDSDITARQLCFGGDKGHGLCVRDLGSPLIHQANNNSYVMGVFSWGKWCANGYPDVYTRVSEYIPWIQSQLTLR